MPQAMRWPSRTALGAIAALLVSLAMLGAACGGGGSKAPASSTPGTTPSARTGDEAAIEAAVRQFFADYNAKNVDGVLAVLSDNVLQQQLNVTRDDAADTLATYLGDPPQELTEVGEIKVSGDTATADVTFKQTGVLLREQEALVRQDGAWIFDDFLPLDTPIPDGMTTIDLTLKDYKFDFDDGAIPNDAAFAFKISNTGQAEHELRLEKVPADFDVDQFVATQELPEGTSLDEITYVGPLAPGDESTIVFSGPLAPGRYVMFSFYTDDEGTPDADKGMTAEFTIK